MSTASDAQLLVEISRRWQAADQLLPTPAVPEQNRGCDAVFIVPSDDGRPIAIGTCEHWHGEPDSLELSWGAARRFQLTARVGGPDVGAVLGGLLQLWRAHLDVVADVDDPDSAAVVMWPSRDIKGIGMLLRRGFAPRSVVAVRGKRHPADEPASSARPAQLSAVGFDVRRARPHDIDSVARLGFEVISYDAHFGGVVERPSTAVALRREVATSLAERQPWIWLAERDGSPVGVLIGEPPPVSWIAPLVGVVPVAYNTLTFVAPTDRGSGVAAALVGCFHQAAVAAGVAATLLHYEFANPLSAPFWARQGYRPLWTSWEARPASTMR